MRKFVGGMAVGLVIGVTAAATASSTARSFYLNRGDTAIDTGGEAQCTTVGTPYINSKFVCKVGGDYRAEYGVIIGSREAALTLYTSFNRYRVIVRRTQSPLP